MVISLRSLPSRVYILIWFPLLEQKTIFFKKQDLKVYLQAKLQEPANLDMIHVDWLISTQLIAFFDSMLILFGSYAPLNIFIAFKSLQG